MSGVTPVSMVVEDYVKGIYAHTEWQSQPITTSALAARLGLAASSVTEMVKKLSAQGLVTHIPYGAVTLTPSGTALALRMVRRHRLIETWLVQQNN
jgi:DtxR family Mn-dependent transcriptional regulator